MAIFNSYVKLPEGTSYVKSNESWSFVVHGADFFCPIGGPTDPGADDIPETWDWRLRVAQWCRRREHVTIEIRWGEITGFKNLMVNQWVCLKMLG